MSDLKGYYDFVIGLVAAPAYYTSSERIGSNTAVGLATVCALIAGLAFRKKTPARSILIILAIAIVAFVIYTQIANAAGMFAWQTVCRALVAGGLALGLGGVSPGGSDVSDADGDDTNSTRSVTSSPPPARDNP